jgi:hypothetical protein
MFNMPRYGTIEGTKVMCTDAGATEEWRAEKCDAASFKSGFTLNNGAGKINGQAVHYEDAGETETWIISLANSGSSSTTRSPAYGSVSK